MSAAEAEEALKDFGGKVRAVIPTFADESGEWLPSVAKLRLPYGGGQRVSRTAVFGDAVEAPSRGPISVSSL